MHLLAFLTPVPNLTVAPCNSRVRLSRRRPSRLPVRACVADNVSPSASSPEASSDSSPSSPPSDDDERAHESWSIYSQPGNRCVICIGRGSSRCMYCFGEGTVKIGPEDVRDNLKCPLCDGSGTEVCPRCEGSGIRPDTRLNVLTLEYEPNLTNEQVLNLPSQAELEERQAAEALEEHEAPQ